MIYLYPSCRLHSLSFSKSNEDSNVFSDSSRFRSSTTYLRNSSPLSYPNQIYCFQCGPRSSRTKAWNPDNAMLSTAPTRQPNLTKTECRPTFQQLGRWKSDARGTKYKRSQNYRVIALLTERIQTAFSLARASNEFLRKVKTHGI